MSPLHQLAPLLAILVAAWFLVRFPRRLFTEAADAAPSRGLELRLAVALAVAGAAAYGVATGLTTAYRLTYALAIMTFVAIVYADLTFLIIPDLYIAVLALIAFAAPWGFLWSYVVFGATVCGGLLAVLALAWRRTTGVEGLGFGDVKLAAVVGGLIGAIEGLLAISISAGLAALLAYGLRLARRRKDAVQLVPYGAALALAGGAGLTMLVL